MSKKKKKTDEKAKEKATVKFAKAAEKAIAAGVDPEQLRNVIEETHSPTVEQDEDKKVNTVDRLAKFVEDNREDLEGAEADYVAVFTMEGLENPIGYLHDARLSHTTGILELIVERRSSGDSE